MLTITSLLRVQTFCSLFFIFGYFNNIRGSLKNLIEPKVNLSDIYKIPVQDFTDDLSEKDKIVSTLVDMGFLAEEAASAIDRCGMLLETAAVRI